MKTINALLFMCIMLLTGCSGNQICFESGNVKSVEGIPITFLSLQKSDGSSYIWENTNIELAKTSLSLTDTLIAGYKLIKYGNVLTPQGEFFRNSTYTVLNHSIGSAASEKFTFITDDSGNPIEVSKPCEN